MSFYAPVELPSLVVAYAQGLHQHKAEYGDVPSSSPTDLKPLVQAASALDPDAEEIHNLELTLAAKKEAYHKKALPLWKKFSEKVRIARVHAGAQSKEALETFLKAFRYHAERHDAVHGNDGPPEPTVKK